MSEISDILFAWTWWSAGIVSLFAVCYEFHTNSEKYVRKMARKNRIDDEGQYYLDFMKDYL